MREFVNDLIPRRYEALTGTLAPAPDSQIGNSQVDLMVVNTLDFPVLVRNGVLAAVLPHSVTVTVEIKTDMSDVAKLGEALDQIRRVHRLFPLGKPPLSVLFSYGYPASSETLATNIEAALNDRVTKDRSWRASDLPNSIMASGLNAACIATLNPDDSDTKEIRVNTFAVKPIETMSYLLSQVLGQLTPKPFRSPSDWSDEPRSEVAVHEHAWTWINGYFDIALDAPIKKTIKLPKPGPDPELAGEE